jgi:putative Mg2+ transporter-C (MgtC) family protein
MEGEIAEFKIIGQALIALLCGGLIGWERESAGKWAGIRTHMLICLAVFLFVKTGTILIQESAERFASDMLRADPVRIIEAIVTGISFIGAGTVFRDRDRNVARGLTTAASMLMAAPIGIAVALEKYILAGGATLITLFILRGVQRMEAKLGHPQAAEGHS